MTKYQKSAKSRFAWHYVSAFMHLIWLVLLVFVLWVGPFGDQIEPPTWIVDCSACQYTANSITSAAQMGRLDIVSIALTVLGVVIAVGAFASFSLIKGAAKDAASDEAEKWLQNNAGEIAKTAFSHMLKNDSRFIAILANKVRKDISVIQGDDALDQAKLDRIVASMEEPKE